MSDQRKVILRSVTLQSKGKYLCEVSADAPSFQTESKQAEMLVVGKYYYNFLKYYIKGPIYKSAPIINVYDFIRNIDIIKNIIFY